MNGLRASTRRVVLLTGRGTLAGMSFRQGEIRVGYGVFGRIFGRAE